MVEVLRWDYLRPLLAIDFLAQSARGVLLARFSFVANSAIRHWSPREGHGLRKDRRGRRTRTTYVRCRFSFSLSAPEVKLQISFAPPVAVGIKKHSLHLASFVPESLLHF